MKTFFEEFWKKIAKWLNGKMLCSIKKYFGEKGKKGSEIYSTNPATKQKEIEDLLSQNNNSRKVIKEIIGKAHEDFCISIKNE